MADETQLERLKRSVEEWNAWRKDNRGAYIDLREASLTEVHGSGADLSYANLVTANLTDAKLAGANLTYCNLSGANLTRADLSSSILIGANLPAAYLIGADLSHAKLATAYLVGVNLSKSNLSNADLTYANLASSDLTLADLTDTTLIGCSMVLCKLRRAKLTGARLHSVTTDGWQIDGAKCDYAYFDQEGVKRTPHDRNFEKREFEEANKSLPMFELLFEQELRPVDILIMTNIVRTMKVSGTGLNIKIDSIYTRGSAPRIRFTVDHEDNVERAQEQVERSYQESVQAYEESTHDFLLNLVESLDDANQDLPTSEARDRF